MIFLIKIIKKQRIIKYIKKLTIMDFDIDICEKEPYPL